jgi:transposase
MAKYKHYDYKQMVMLPISLEDQLSPGTLEFAIHTLVETRMDLSLFDDKYKNYETGCLAYDPEILLKIVLFAYSRGLTGSRKIEQACRENVVFMLEAHPPFHYIEQKRLSRRCRFVWTFHQGMPKERS